MPGMFDRLLDSNSLLDQINKGLNAYLEKKRLFFSRWSMVGNILFALILCLTTANNY